MTIANYEPRNETEKALWDFICARAEVTHAMLKAEVDASDYQRTNFVAKLKRLGILHKCGTRESQTLFTVLNSDERQQKSAEKRKTPEGVMWTVMRVTKEFSPNEIYMLIGRGRPDITPKSVNTYCQKLLKAGYFKVTQTAKPNQRPARYRLINDTGPLAPTVHRKEVIIDANDGKVAHVEGAQL